MKKHILLIIIVVILGALPLFIQYGAYIHCTDFSKQQLHDLDVSENCIRLSVGLEDMDDVFEDIRQALTD